jgi:hypothetical protein
MADEHSVLLRWNHDTKNYSLTQASGNPLKLCLDLLDEGPLTANRNLITALGATT